MIRKDSLGRVYKTIDDHDILWFDFTISEADSYFYQERDFLPQYVVKNTSNFSSPLLPGFISPEHCFILHFHTRDQTDSDYIYTFAPSVGMVVESGGLGINFVLHSATINGQVISTVAHHKNSKFSHRLKSNYPNPFNPRTMIRFDLAYPAFISLTIVNMNGQVVDILAQEMRSSGSHAILFDGSTLPSGIYFAILESDSFIYSQKMLLVK
jgi:hypothetical protein